MQKWKQEERDLLLQLEDHSKGDEQFYIAASYLLDVSQRAYDLFLSSQPEQKRRFLNFVLANLKMEGKKLVHTLKEPFEAMYKMGISNEWLCAWEEIRTEFVQNSGAAAGDGAR